MVPGGMGFQESFVAKSRTELAHHGLELGTINVDSSCLHQLFGVERLVALEKTLEGVAKGIFVAEVGEVALWPIVHLPQGNGAKPGFLGHFAVGLPQALAVMLARGWGGLQMTIFEQRDPTRGFRVARLGWDG